jgi:hypothetical protein
MRIILLSLLFIFISTYSHAECYYFPGGSISIAEFFNGKCAPEHTDKALMEEAKKDHVYVRTIGRRVVSYNTDRPLYPRNVRDLRYGMPKRRIKRGRQHVPYYNIKMRNGYYKVEPLYYGTKPYWRHIK